MDDFLVGGHLTSDIGPRGGRFHRGVDIALPVGTPITVPPGQWMVERAGWENMYDFSQGYGQHVVLRNMASGVSITAAHLSTIIAQQNQILSGGDVLGLSGNTGHSTGPHLHLEAAGVQGALIDPLALYGTNRENLTGSLSVAAASNESQVALNKAMDDLASAMAELGNAADDRKVAIVNSFGAAAMIGTVKKWIFG